MTSLLRRLVLALSAVALALTALPAAADTTVAFDDLDVSAADGVLTVDGDVDLAGAPIVIEDGAGDAVHPDADIERAEVELLNDRTALFRIVLASPLPAPSTTTLTMIRWELTSSGGDEVDLTAMHNRFSAPGEWSYDLQSCSTDPQTGQGTCSGPSVFGTYTDGVIEMEVGLSALGIGLGDTLTSRDQGLHVTQTGAGAIWLNGPVPSESVSHGPLTIPPLTVTVTNAATGEDVVDTPARGTFRVAVPGAAGDDLDVQACLADTCVTETVRA